LARYAEAFEREASDVNGGDGMATIKRVVAELITALPPPPEDPRTKAARQPAGMTVPEMQVQGTAEAAKLFGIAVAKVKAAGLKTELSVASSCAKRKKSAGRAFEKAYERWGGDPRAVTDYGRATLCTITLAGLARVLRVTVDALQAAGYVVVGVKSTLDSAVDTAASGGYRNALLLFKCPRSNHVVELQHVCTFHFGRLARRGVLHLLSRIVCMLRTVG
jgi:hypothetical protein